MQMVSEIQDINRLQYNCKSPGTACMAMAIWRGVVLTIH